MKYILGISYGHHESSCCLISSEGSIFYLREEWLSRVKNDYRFPVFALSYLNKNFPGLEKNLISICLFEKPLKNWLGIGTKKYLSVVNYLNKLRQFKKSDIFFEKDLKKVFKQLPEIIYCPHHLSHLYTTEFFSSTKDENTINIIFDGYGEGLSGALYKGQGKKIKLLKKYGAESSLGLTYSGITEWAGFNPNEDEYKVMALAGYGVPKFEKFIQENIIQYNIDSLDIKINSDFFNFSDSGLPTIKKKFIEVFGVVNHQISILKQKNILNVISSFQVVIEKLITNLIIQLSRKNSNSKQFLLSGGLFHNSRLVGHITKSIDKMITVSPSPGDAGSSIGAAYFSMICNNKKFIESISNPYIGPKIQDISSYTHLFKKVKSSNSFAKIKEILKNDEIFAVFSGFCEVGPRALLSRSLCCNAKSNKALKKLNTLIKKRESFRPIAPVISKEYLLKNFICNIKSLDNSYWMGQLLWPKSNAKLSQMPFLHIDSSVRAQVFDRKNKMHMKFVPILLQKLLNSGNIIANTSLNIAGDPMVFLPEDLYINCKRLEIKFIIQEENLYEIL